MKLSILLNLNIYYDLKFLFFWIFTERILFILNKQELRLVMKISIHVILTDWVFDHKIVELLRIRAC